MRVGTRAFTRRPCHQCEAARTVWTAKSNASSSVDGLHSEHAAMTCGNGSGNSTVGNTIASHAMRRPDAPAIVCPNLEVLSFGDLAHCIELIGNQLRSAGVSTNSRIGIALPRGPAAAILGIAACCNGILVPLNPGLSNTDLEAELKCLRLDALIASEDLHRWTSLAGEACGLFATVKSSVPGLS